MPQQDLESIHNALLGEIGGFSKENPEIMEALEVMNLSMTEYLQAMEVMQGDQTRSCSSSSHIPFQLRY